MKKCVRTWILRHPLLSIFLLALGLRLSAWVLFNLILFQGQFEHPDSLYYHEEGIGQAARWAAGELSLIVYPTYSNIPALFYWLFGPNPVLPELTNVFLSSLIPIVGFYTIRNFSTLCRPAFLGALLLASDPYSIYLSTQLLKEALVLLLLAAVLWGATHPKLSGVFWGSLALGLLVLLRTRLGVPVGVLLSVLLLLRRPYLRSLLTAPCLLVAIYLPSAAIGIWTVSHYTIDYERIVPDVGRLAVFDGDIQPVVQHTEFFDYRPLISPTKLLGKVPLPKAVAYTFGQVRDFLTFPYLWTANNFREGAFALYMLWWYGVLGLLLAAGITSASYLRSALPLLIMGAVLGLGLTLVVSTTSAFVRWRVEAFYPLILAAGLTAAYLPTTKRLFDVLTSGLVLILSSPVWLVVSGLLLTTRHRILFTQKRFGLGNKEFTIYKFVTMLEGSDGCSVRGGADGRITKLGRFLRATALDELPELVNILKGDMSLVGPRPHACWEQIQLEGWNDRYSVKPGLIGLAQYKCHRSDLETKLKYDLEYIKRQSFWFDLKLIFLGVWTSLRREWV